MRELEQQTVEVQSQAWGTGREQLQARLAARAVPAPTEGVCSQETQLLSSSHALHASSVPPDEGAEEGAATHMTTQLFHQHKGSSGMLSVICMPFRPQNCLVTG